MFDLEFLPIALFSSGTENFSQVQVKMVDPATNTEVAVTRLITLSSTNPVRVMATPTTATLKAWRPVNNDTLPVLILTSYGSVDTPITIRVNIRTHWQLSEDEVPQFVEPLP